jgi:hypothetical protein
MYARNNNVTYISELPELEDLDQNKNSQQMFQQNGPSSGIPDKYKKFIRTGMGTPSPESGMNSKYPPQQQEFLQPQPQPHPHPHPHPQYQQQEEQSSNLLSDISCLDIHGHVVNCPICSRYYKTDSSIYIIAIVVLCIICILLLKRVLNL